MILKEKKSKPQTYEISKRPLESMTIDEVVAEMEELIDMKGRGDWVDHVMEQFSSRLCKIDKFIVSYFLKGYKRK